MEEGNAVATCAAVSARVEDDSFDRLSDDVLLKILCRLPSSKDVVRCKAVCKRWLSVVMAPDMIQQFTSHHVRTTGADHDSFGLILTAFIKDQLKGQLLSARHLSESTIDGDRFLSSCSNTLLSDSCRGIIDYSVKVLAACNDLVLWRRWDMDTRELYISNPRTRDWVVLPRLPCHYQSCLLRLTCEDSDPYGYRVLHVSCTFDYEYQYEGHMFSSETGNWDKVILSSPKPFLMCRRGTKDLFHHGTLYLYKDKDRGNGMITFDPFIKLDDKEGYGVVFYRCHFVNWPSDFFLISCTNVLITVGVCQGSIRLSLAGAKTITVWELKDYSTSKWESRHTVDLRELVARDPFVRSYIHSGNLVVVLGFDPFVDDGIYLHLGTHVVFCDFKQRLLDRSVLIHPETSEDPANLTHFLSQGFISPVWLMLPWWPTPLQKDKKLLLPEVKINTP